MIQKERIKKINLKITTSPYSQTQMYNNLTQIFRDEESSSESESSNADIKSLNLVDEFQFDIEPRQLNLRNFININDQRRTSCNLPVVLPNNILRSQMFIPYQLLDRNKFISAENFFPKSQNKTSIDDNYILENILTFLKDQNGCRIAQKKIDENDKDYAIKLFTKIQVCLSETVNDQFGNYVIQKIIDKLNKNYYVITKFFEIVADELYEISINPFGTRVFQKILDYFIISYRPNAKINQIFRDLILGHALDLINDTNGNHVFQKIMIIFPRNKNQFIFDELNKICIEVSMSKKGGCIYQKAFSIASDSQKVI